MFLSNISIIILLITLLSININCQGINFRKYGGSKWPNGSAIYLIDRNFNINERNIIQKAIDKWNSQVNCIKFRKWQNGDNDWIHFFPGNGCHSYVGRLGGEQKLSLGNGCVYESITLHEMMHAIGFTDEQNRYDRDDNIQILWDNIPDDWKEQYEKTNPDDFGLQFDYDFYSVMHYPVKAPGTNRDAFRVKKINIYEARIGRGKGFTESDINKINNLYCSNIITENNLNKIPPLILR